jgi:hypothetical protein
MKQISDYFRLSKNTQLDIHSYQFFAVKPELFQFHLKLLCCSIISLLDGWLSSTAIEPNPQLHTVMNRNYSADGK